MSHNINPLIAQVDELLAHDLEIDLTATDELARLLFQHTIALCLAGEGARVAGGFSRVPAAVRHRHPVFAAAEVVMLARMVRYREAALGGARLTVIPGAGPFPHEVTPESVPAALIRFPLDTSGALQ